MGDYKESEPDTQKERGYRIEIEGKNVRGEIEFDLARDLEPIQKRILELVVKGDLHLIAGILENKDDLSQAGVGVGDALSMFSGRSLETLNTLKQLAAWGNLRKN